MGRIISFLLIITILPVYRDSSLKELSFSNRENDSIFEKMAEMSNSSIPKTFMDSFDVSDSEKNGKQIKMFDVSNNGDILVCFHDGSANVYNENLEFDFSISYSTASMQSSSIFWDKDNIVIFLDRSDILVYLDEDHEILKSYKIPNTFENAEIYHNIMNQRVINYNDYTYTLKRNLLECKLIRTESNGQSELVYSANSTFVNALEILAILLVCISALVLIVMIIEWKHILSVIKKRFK